MYVRVSMLLGNWNLRSLCKRKKGVSKAFLSFIYEASLPHNPMSIKNLIYLQVFNIYHFHVSPESYRKYPFFNPWGGGHEMNNFLSYPTDATYQVWSR